MLKTDFEYKSSFHNPFQKLEVLMWNMSKNDRKNEVNGDLGFTRYISRTTSD